MNLSNKQQELRPLETQGRSVPTSGRLAVEPLHLHLLPDPEDLHLGLGELGLCHHQGLGGSQVGWRAEGGTSRLPGHGGHTARNGGIRRLLEANHLGSGQVDLDDPSLNNRVVEPDESVVGILPPGHGDEPEALAPLVVVDDLGVLHVPKVGEEQDQVVLPEILPR